MIYGEIIQKRLDQLNLTVYGAAQMIACESDLDEPITTVNQRIRQLIERDPKSLTQFAEIVRGLGGEVVIKWQE